MVSNKAPGPAVGGHKAGEAKVESSDGDDVGARVALSPEASVLVGARSADSEKAVTIYEPSNASVKRSPLLRPSVSA